MVSEETTYLDLYDDERTLAPDILDSCRVIDSSNWSCDRYSEYDFSTIGLAGRRRTTVGMME